MKKNSNNLIGGKKMTNNNLRLYNEFKKIKNMGWIESKRKGPSGIGYTFETLLNKKEDNISEPDYRGIEIKTIRLFSKQKIHLINAIPNGDMLYPTKNIVEKIGYPDKKNPEYKVFNMTFNAKEYTNIGYYKKGIIEVDEKNKKIRFIVKNDKNEILDLPISWNYDYLKEKINKKLNKLAIIYTYSKEEQDKEYFYYKSIHFYKFNSFEKFIQMIKEGNIEITFKISIIREGEKKGLIKDRGTDFSIKKDKINLLFDEINIFEK